MLIFQRTNNLQTSLATVHQGKAKDLGWGSDDEAAALPEAEAEEAAPAPAPTQTARKQVASAFDLLQGSDDEPTELASAADADSDAEPNGAVESAAESDSDSDLGDQVMCCLHACTALAVSGVVLQTTTKPCKPACPRLAWSMPPT